MQYDAGIDVSLEQSSVCVVDAAGKIVKEFSIFIGGSPDKAAFEDVRRYQMP